MKKYLFIATALVALASCSSDEFVGDNTSPTTSNTPGAIQFTSNTPRITRAEGATAAEALGYKFKVYATKDVTVESTTTTSNVFATGAYSNATDYNAAPDAYWVWWGETNAGATASNTNGWEYVGAAGDHGTTDHKATIATGKDQTIKYWDYSANKYEFVAFSATVTDGTIPYSITKYNKDGFTITATAAELAGLYVADKKVITSTDYKKDVQFTFRSAAAKVRLGIYETINGYVVKNVSFRPNGTITDFSDATTANAILSGSFNGTSSNASGTYNVTYASSEPRIAIFNADNTTTNIQSGYFNFGTFTSTSNINTSSTDPTWASGTANYQGVLPNTDYVGNMILYVDYDLYNEKSGETIHVKGAKAVVPAMYMTWNPNYAYTYLFKISDNTNGTTGTTEGTDPAGLFPITFDALTIAAAETEVGTITTVSTPAITTYQKGSVVDNVSTSEHGITYASNDNPIYITVNTNGTLATLTSKIMLYKLATADADATEADLVLEPSKLTNNEVASNATDKLTILSGEGETVQGISFAASTSAKFTPLAGQTYAVEFTDDNSVKHYKVIKVAAANNNSGSGSNP